jgi:hypothetical protein
MELQPDYVNSYLAGGLPALVNAAENGHARAKLRPFVGFLDAAEDVAGVPMRKLYSDAGLEDGVELRVVDIQRYTRTPRSREDGLKRDVVFVRSDANVTYFSKRRPKADGPRGGNGGDTGGSI